MLLKTGECQGKSIKFQELMKHDMYLDMKLVSANVDQMQVFVIISNPGIKTNANL